MLDEGGEGAVRIKTVAAIAHITEPSVYHFFGSRAGLIEAAQLTRFHRSQNETIERFGKAIRTCSTKAEVATVIDAALRVVFDRSRFFSRQMRAEILGGAQSRPALLDELTRAQTALLHDLEGHVIWAQDRGFIPTHLNAYAFGMWITSLTSAFLVVEMDNSPGVTDAWLEYTMTSVMNLLEMHLD